jgi:hypothetical protein
MKKMGFADTKYMGCIEADPAIHLFELYSKCNT